MASMFSDRWREIVDKFSSSGVEAESAIETVDAESVVVDEVVSSVSENEVSHSIATLSDAMQCRIESNLTKWLGSKCYCNKEITIQSVAGEIHTNRTYLSLYINSVYGCSFKMWITKLRLDEAKRLLCDTDEVSIAAIANQVGFSSTTSFIHVFKRRESLPPAMWREKHKELRAALLNMCEE